MCSVYAEDRHQRDRKVWHEKSRYQHGVPLGRKRQCVCVVQKKFTGVKSRDSRDSAAEEPLPHVAVAALWRGTRPLTHGIPAHLWGGGGKVSASCYACCIFVAFRVQKACSEYIV